MTSPTNDHYVFVASALHDAFVATFANILAGNAAFGFRHNLKPSSFDIVAASFAFNRLWDRFAGNGASVKQLNDFAHAKRLVISGFGMLRFREKSRFVRTYPANGTLEALLPDILPSGALADSVTSAAHSVMLALPNKSTYD